MGLSAREYAERIETIRAEEAPAVCPTCGSTTPEPITEKWCSGCQQVLPIEQFNRRFDKWRGANSYRHLCRACAARSTKAWRARRAIREIRRAS
jgi:hypothetical protein